MLNNAPRRISRTALALTLLAALFGTIAPALFAQSDPLASWNDGAVKKTFSISSGARQPQAARTWSRSRSASLG